MASNVVKKLQIELDGHSFADLAGLIEEKVIEKIQELIESECSELSNMGEDGNTELLLEDTDVSITGDGLEANIYFNRESGKFASTEDVEDEVLKIIKDLKKGNIKQEELEKVKINTKADFIFSLDNSSSTADLFGTYFAKGDINPLIEYEEHISKLTIEEIKNVANKYFNKENSTTIILKKGKSNE
jgi:ribosome-binding factor A